MNFFSTIANSIKESIAPKTPTPNGGGFFDVLKGALSTGVKSAVGMVGPLSTLNTVLGTKKTMNVVNAAAGFAKEGFQSTARTFVNTSKVIANPKTGYSMETIPKGKVEQAYFGKEAFSFKTASDKTQTFLTGLGVEAPTAKKWAMPLVLVGSLLDLTPGSGAKKEAETLTKVGLDAVAKSKQLPDIVENLVKVFKFSRKDAIEVAPSLTTIDKPNGVLKRMEEFINGKAGVVDDAVEEAQKIQSIDEVSNVFDSKKYVQENVARREAERQAGNPVGYKAKTIDFYNNLKKKFIDTNAPIEDTLEAALKESNMVLPESRNITNNIDRVLRSNSLTGQFAKDNGLTTVIKNVEDLNMLDEYLIAKQATDVNTRGLTTGRDLTKDQKLIQELAPQMEQYATVVNTYTKKLLDEAVGGGIISKETADMLKSRYPSYVPLQRVFSEIDESSSMKGGGSGVANLSAQTIVRRLEGSERAIESPIHSILEKTNDLFLQVEKNKTFQQLTGYETLPGNPFNLKQLNNLDEVSRNKGTITGFVNGEKQIWETSKEIADAAKSLNVQNMSIVGKIIAFPVRVLKLGVTGVNAAFGATNIVRDQLTSFINSSNSVKTSIANPKVFLRAVTSVFKHDELYEEFVRAGAGGTSFDISRNAVSETVEGIRSRKNVLTRAKYLVTNPSQLLRAVEDQFGRFEEATRLQQYIGTKESLLKTTSVGEATLGAARAARENTANFSRRGEYGQVINSMVPYLNAGVQGSRAYIRSAKRDPKGVALKVATVLLLPEAINTMWAMSDPERKAAWNSIADYEKEGNYIIIPPNPTQDENGRWNVIKIPKPPGVANLTNLVRRPLEAMHGLNPVKFNEMVSSIIGTVSPIEPNIRSITSTLSPQGLKPSLEQLTNQNFFTGSPIIPKSLEGNSPALQVKNDTSGTAKIIGGFLNVSPINVQDFIRGTFGGIGLQGLNLTDRVLAGAGVIEKKDIKGQSIITAITDRFNKARGVSSDDGATETLKKILQTQSDERLILREKAEVIYTELKALPKDEANAKVLEIKKVDEALFEKIKEVADDTKKGLTYGDRLIRQLGVENGSRAKYIYEVANALPTKDEKNAYIEELQDKGLVSTKVLEQIREVAKQQKNK